MEKIYFYYTNDLHSYFNNWPKVASYFKQKKKERLRYDETFRIVDVGDHVDRVSPITEGSKGKANISLLNDLGYDYVTLGNNEGITFGYEDFYHLYDEANFEIICSNLNCEKEENPDWLKHVLIDTTPSGVRMGIIGLTAAFNPYYNLLGFHVDESIETLKKQVNYLKDKTDIIILLSHVGINEDRLIAETFSEINVIIGGHTHHLLRVGEEVNESIITAGGKFCSFVGEVILTWDHVSKKLIRKEAYTTDITFLPDDKETTNLLNVLATEAAINLDKKVIDLKEDLVSDWYKETKLMKKLTADVKEKTVVDCVLLNSGLILSDFTAGVVTYGDVHDKCPHPINICIVNIKGDELIEVVRVSLTEAFINLKLRGFGFRGDILGRMVFAGIKVETDNHEQGEYVKSITMNNKPIDKDKVYSVATADAFTFGRLLPEIARSKNKQLLLPEFVRDILADTLIKHYS